MCLGKGYRVTTALAAWNPGHRRSKLGTDDADIEKGQKGLRWD